METIFQHPEGVSFDEGKYFRVMILSEEAASAEKICDILHILLRALEADARRLFCEWGSFERLTVQESWQEFATQAVVADMIIIGIHQRLVLPERLASWLAELPALRNERPGALVAVLGGEPGLLETEPEALAQLRQAEVPGLLDFFISGTADSMNAPATRRDGFTVSPPDTDPAFESPDAWRPSAESRS